MNSLLIAGNILKRAFRNKKELLILTLLPILIISIMTYFTTQNDQVSIDIAYVNLDGALGNALISHLELQEGFSMAAIEEEELAAMLENDQIRIALVIPEDFSPRIAQNERTEVLLHSSEDYPSAALVKQHINQFIVGLYALHAEGDASMLVEFTHRMENPTVTAAYRIAGRDAEIEDYESKLSSLGFVITFIMMLIFIAMGTLLEDKKRLTLARIFSYPVKGWEVVTGNLVGSLGLGLLQLIPILFALKIIFQIPWGQTFIGFILVFLAFLLTTIGLGIGLAGIIKKNFNPILLIATVIVPTSILGGAFIPASMMPDFADKAGYIVPQKWVMDALEKLLQGASIDAVLVNIGIILLFGLAFATFGIQTLKPLSD